MNEDPLTDANLQSVGDAIRRGPPQERLDLGYHGNPLRLVARELLALEGADEVDVAWMLYHLARGETP